LEWRQERGEMGQAQVQQHKVEKTVEKKQAHVLQKNVVKTAVAELQSRPQVQKYLPKIERPDAELLTEKIAREFQLTQLLK
jgi:hypothetical protein